MSTEGRVQFESREAEGVYAILRIVQIIIAEDFAVAASPELADPEFRVAFQKVVDKLAAARFGEFKRENIEAEMQGVTSKISAAVRALIVLPQKVEGL